MIRGSRVISNSERTPFVIVGEEGREETSIALIDCSHTSSSFPSLLPLASLESHSSSSASPFDEDVAQTVEIASHGLYIRDASLIIGTGPLFDFNRFGPQLERKEMCFVKTKLSSSCFLNTTSDFMGSVSSEAKGRDCGSDVGLARGVSQSLIGTSVYSCTNHLSGTAIHDLNLGGSILSKNTSFTHTTTTSEYHNQHKTTQTNLTTAHVLHSFSLCTFKHCTPQFSGGAVDLYDIDADLKFESCSFDTCSSMGGAAITIYQVINQGALTVSSSSFVGCSATYSGGGSLSITHMTSLSVSDSVFLDSHSESAGGAAFVDRWKAQPSDLGFSNCLFQNCLAKSSSGGEGGAIHFSHCTAIRLHSLRFRGCSSAAAKGHDMFFNTYDAHTYPLPTVSLLTVSNCDSTSTPEGNRFGPTTLTTDPILPTPAQTATILSLTAQQTSTTEVEIVVALNRTVSGQFLVLVSNVGGSQRTDPTKAPNIGRVLLFTLSSSKVGKMTVSTGDAGLLQLPLEDYTVIAASLSDHVVSFSDPPIVLVTLHPTLLSANCVLDESHTMAVLNLEGSGLDGETFVFTLHDQSTFQATFASSKASVTLGLIVSGKKLNSESISMS